MDQATLWLIDVRDNRNETAFRKLFDHLAPKLSGYLQKRGLSKSQAEDILQDAFVAIWQKAHQFDAGRANASAWIYQIARNKMIDHLRGEPMPLPDESDAPSDEEGPENAMIMQSEIAQLQQALSKLNSDQKALIELSFLQEKSHQEIMAQLNIPLGTIKSRIRLGLEKLRYNLKDSLR